MGAIFNDFVDLLNGNAPGTTNAGIAAGTAADSAIQTGTGTNSQTGQTTTVTDSNLALLNAGMITQAQYDASADAFADSEADDNTDTVENTFTTAVGTELQNPLSSLFGTWGTWLKTALSAIPWWVWAIGGVFIFAWIGGFGWAAKKSKGALNK